MVSVIYHHLSFDSPSVRLCAVIIPESGHVPMPVFVFTLAHVFRVYLISIVIDLWPFTLNMHFYIAYLGRASVFTLGGCFVFYIGATFHLLRALGVLMVSFVRFFLC